MDFTIRDGQMSFVKETTALTDIFCTMNCQKGDWFMDSNYGVDWKSFRKVTAATLPLIEQAVVAALQWLIQSGRITTVSCLAEVDSSNGGQVDIKVNATQADGMVITYQQYRPVGMGPTTDYSIINGQVVTA